MIYIKRHAENTIIKISNMFKVVLIIGAPRIGKTSILKNLYPHISYINLNNSFIENLEDNIPIILDNLQYKPNIFRDIKLICDKNNNKGLYFLSGYHPLGLMNIVSDSLAGRIAIIELTPLSLREIMNDSFDIPFLPTMEYVLERKKTVNKPENIWNIIHKGGYPELYSSNIEWNIFYGNYIRTYIERDVRTLSNVQDLETFRKFMIACAYRTGQMLNYSNIADEIGKDAKTVKNWISILEASGIIYILEPYHSNTLKRVIKTPKIYFKDTGLVAYLTRWLTPETLANGAMSGSVFETFVISEILKSYSNLGLDYRYFVSYYRGKDKSKKESEIDFIIEQDGILYPIEVKQSNKVSADMTSAFQVLDNIPGKERGMGAVICMCPAVGSLRDNILQIPVWYI